MNVEGVPSGPEQRPTPAFLEWWYTQGHPEGLPHKNIVRFCGVWLFVVSAIPLLFGSVYLEDFASPNARGIYNGEALLAGIIYYSLGGSAIVIGFRLLMDKNLFLGQVAILLTLLSPLGNLNSQFLVTSMGLWAAVVFLGGYTFGILSIIILHRIRRDRIHLLEKAFSQFIGSDQEVGGPPAYGIDD